jgi:hypothetical protein
MFIHESQNINMLTKSVLQKRKISSSDASGSAATATGTLEEIQQSCKEEINEPKKQHKQVLCNA